MLLIDLCFRKLGRKNLHDITMLDPGGLVVLVVLLHKDSEGVRGLGCGAGGSSLGLGGDLLAVDHQLEPGRGTCAIKLWVRKRSTFHDNDRKLFYWYPSSCCGGL